MSEAPFSAWRARPCTKPRTSTSQLPLRLSIGISLYTDPAPPTAEHSCCPVLILSPKRTASLKGQALTAPSQKTVKIQMLTSY